MSKNTGVFIPARLGSERLPNKLILPIGNTCLFEIACAKLDSLHVGVDKYVLIEEDELYEIAVKYKNLNIIIRDKSTSTLDGPLDYIFKDLKKVNNTHLMFLNPCLPFITQETILDSLNEFNNHYSDSATSVIEFNNWVLDSQGYPVVDIDFLRLSTKEIRGYKQFAHVFHIFNKDRFFETGEMLDEDFYPIEVPRKQVIDVDTELDYMYVRWLWENEILHRH